MQKLLNISGRKIYLVSDSSALVSVYYILDKEVGGILINTPEYSDEVAVQLKQAGGVSFIFYPSFFGAKDVDLWRNALNAETMASEVEQSAIQGTVDISIDSKTKLTRTIDFLTMAGRTRGSCALRLKNLPGAIFFGPILSPNDSGWPGLNSNDNDYSFESRIFGALALKDLKYDYAFTDKFTVGVTKYGPEVSRHINAEIESALDLD